MNIISPIGRRNADLRPAFGSADTGAAGMSTIERGDIAPGVAPGAPALAALLAEAPAQSGDRIRVHGKFFFAGETKHFVKGVTYGPFGPGSHGSQFPERAVVEEDFALMRAAGV